MLSKKQARGFFLGGTLVTFLIFIGLTVFSLSASQDQTNDENITESVVRGKKIWEQNNCMGCHTILGEETVIGGTAIGLVEEENLIKNNNIKEGDSIFVTKPLGVQMVVNIIQDRNGNKGNYENEKIKNKVILFV